MSCGLQNPPALPGKATRPLNWPGPGLLARAGEANIWAASGCVWGFLSSLLDQPVPGVPSCEGSAQTMRRRRADDAGRRSPAPAAEVPGRGWKMPLGPHSPACCNPLGWRHRGRSKNCVVQSAAREQGAWRGPPRPIKTTPKISFACVTDHLAALQLGAGAQRARRVMGQR